MKQILFSFMSICLTASAVFADDIVLKDPALRAQYIQQGKVWIKPVWISPTFIFNDDLNVRLGPKAKNNDHLLLENTVVCQMTEKDIDPDSSGATPKFTCQLMENDQASGKHKLVLKKNGKTDKIKVKYEWSKGFRLDQNMEVFAEVVGTRLLWALGFGADQMFAVETVLCYGCTEDPFYDRRIDPTSLEVPRVFFGAAIERKLEGKEVIFENSPRVPPRSYGPPSKNFSYQPPSPKQYPLEGWGFSESMDLLPLNTEQSRQEKIHRDALRLLAVFMDHDDNKPENNRMLCTGTLDETSGLCAGEVRLIVQDLGAILGDKVSITLKKPRFTLAWGERNLWKNPKACIGNIGISAISRDFGMMYPQISEEGRQFLVHLLNGFANGPEGRKRVEGLFEAAHVVRLGQTPAQWADAFMNRLEQLNYPVGREHPNFACPTRIH
jgi:hypothetical protein